MDFGKDNVSVNDKVITKAREKMFGGEHISIVAEIEADVRFEPQEYSTKYCL